MLYLDGISLSRVREELKEILVGKKTNRIFKNNEHSISLFFGKTELVFSCMPNFPVCYLAQNKEKPILDEASTIVSNLRKYLMNAILIEIEQLGFDRILVFHFSKINELGELKKNKLYFECAGKLLNLILVDEENKVIDSLKKFSLSENLDRTLFRGELYVRPKYEDKISPLDLKEEKFNLLKEEKKSLSACVEGMGKVLENNIKTYEDYKKVIFSKSKPKIYFKNKDIKLATVLDIKAKDFDNKLEIKEFETFNDMINFYITYKFQATSYSILKNRLLSMLNKKIKKVKKILTLIKKDMENPTQIESIKEQADIVAANLYSIKKGMNVLETFDFYNNKEIKINLDPLLSPKSNLDKIYKKYNKEKRKLENAKRRKIEMTEELTYLESTLLFIERSEDVNSLREIEDELIKLNYIRVVNKKKNTKLKKEVKYGIFEMDNSLIFYGRNNLENDNLTFKVANKNDYWFHVKDIPSSHVIVKTNFLTDNLIKKASEISAFYTKLNLGEKVLVEYTQKKHVNKPKGAKPGFVTYDNQKSITVEKVEI
ncbi:MAG: NFACT family protein [Fusobacterium sp.]|nr:NFACT family protein [Fusobacterium sp.]